MSHYAANKAPICPGCGTQMVERVNKAKGTYFWGCKKFPHCRETLPMEGDDEDETNVETAYDEDDDL
jgi:ssDNA-binding Zn-finger/Zn-ribbon topoisomerase 1